jgi:hypothetical protein
MAGFHVHLAIAHKARLPLTCQSPGARFIALPGRNHLFLEHEPASDRSASGSRKSYRGNDLRRLIPRIAAVPVRPRVR